jgi:hypothetical protein
VRLRRFFVRRIGGDAVERAPRLSRRSHPDAAQSKDASAGEEASADAQTKSPTATGAAADAAAADAGTVGQITQFSAGASGPLVLGSDGNTTSSRAASSPSTQAPARRTMASAASPRAA